MRRAFLLEPVKTLDVSTAEDYGKIEVVFPYEGSRSSMWEDSYVCDLMERLDGCGFDPYNDMLILAGNQALICITLAEMVARYGAIDCLLWNSTSRTYVPRTLGVSDERSGEAGIRKVERPVLRGAD